MRVCCHIVFSVHFCKYGRIYLFVPSSSVASGGVTSENTTNVAATETSPPAGGEITTTNQRVAASNSERRRHVKAVKIFLGLMLMYIVSFTPLWMITTNESYDRLLVYLYYLNHACNILVYYIVDPDFRRDLKKLLIK